MTVLLVSADANLRADLRARLSLSRWKVMEAEGGADGLSKLDSDECHVLLLDPALPDLEIGEFRSLVASRYPHLQVVAMNSHTGKPFVPPVAPLGMEVVSMIDRHGPVHAFAQSAPAIREGDSDAGLPGLIGIAPAMHRIYSLARMVAPRDTTVLISGESGTGKDLVAQAIHRLSPRYGAPFVVINCAAIPEPLLEAELFGYVKGAFTGAVQSRVGRIHSAHKGTLFLDEIGDMPLALQSKILRFLEQGEVQRLGSTDNFRVDVRVIAATNSRLDESVKQKLFREDLYYRLAVFPIHLPQLRERISDVPALAIAFLAKFATRSVSIHEEAMRLLQQHTWPGNVRELRNMMERASILVGSGTTIMPEHLSI